MQSDIIWSNCPADVWGEAYPVGNGRLGGMVLGGVAADRVSLNHDRLWRRYWKYQDRNLAEVFPKYQQLCLEKKFDEAIALMRDNVIGQADGYYVNPFVPVGDIGIYPWHGDAKISDYRRQLNMADALVNVSYSVDGVKFKRECLASWPAGIMTINLSADKPAGISGEYSLYRVPDIECKITGSANGNELVMEGCFDEGVKFAAVVRAIAKGGDISVGLADYNQPEGPVAQKYDKFAFGFREFEHPKQPCGISLKVNKADEVALLISIATDRETDGNLVQYCKARLDSAGEDYEKIRADHIDSHKELYQRVSLELEAAQSNEISTPQFVQNVRNKNEIDAAAIERLFNLGRYMAIAAGRPEREGEPFKAPINLQGIWNEDPRPAWDSDYHLDLNLQMCYWGLGQVNLSELGGPLVDWAWSLLPQAKHAAKDMYGLSGAYYTGVCDVENLGNFDDLFMLATGTNAWLAQSLWQVWEYSRDKRQLREKIYPIIGEIAEFYVDLLKEDSQGRLVTAPSGSPENIPTGREIGTILSAMSTFDIELLRELFTNLITAGKLLEVDFDRSKQWQSVFQKLPMPTINEEDRLLEWLDEDYETVDPGHRHRSHLVGICPSQRITVEDTPDYAEAVVKALELRHSYGCKGSCTLDVASDAQIYARLYRPVEALGKIKDVVANHAMGNLMLCLCDWRPESGLRWFGEKRVFQMEASMGTMAAIAELFVQDMGGLIRLLPALPGEFPDGEITGIRCRGGFEVDIKWQEGKLQEARIKSLLGNKCSVKLFGDIDAVKIISPKTSQKLICPEEVIEFLTSTDAAYVIMVHTNA